MSIRNFSNELTLEVAQSADLCMKPWKHAVFNQTNLENIELESIELDELIFLIECRCPDGVRNAGRDLQLEIYKSGVDVIIMLSLNEDKESPILWQGKHSFWMDGITGKRCNPPLENQQIESLARRLRAKFANIFIK